MRRFVKAAMVLSVLLHLGFWNGLASGAERNGKAVNRGVPTPDSLSANADVNRIQPNEMIVKRARLAEPPGSTPPRVERASEPDKTSSEDASSAALPLPNTMDGLNDKRPLSIGDRLSFKVVEDEGSPRSLIVTDSSEVEVPFVGLVSVGNKTCKQFALYVKKLLEKDYYYQATVIVGLDAAGSQGRVASRGRVYVMGQVRSPGPQEIPANEPYSVGKAILRAGGFGPYANKKKVKLVKGGKTGSKPTFINVGVILDEGQWDKDVEVSPDDIITVPERIFNILNN